MINLGFIRPRAPPFPGLLNSLRRTLRQSEADAEAIAALGSCWRQLHGNPHVYQKEQRALRRNGRTGAKKTSEVPFSLAPSLLLNTEVCSQSPPRCRMSPLFLTPAPPLLNSSYPPSRIQSSRPCPPSLPPLHMSLSLAPRPTVGLPSCQSVGLDRKLPEAGTGFGFQASSNAPGTYLRSTHLFMPNAS